MDFWNKATLRSLLIPNSLVLLAAIVLLESRWIVIPASIVTFFYYAVFATGMLLAWRFHSSRILFSLLTLLLAHRAVEFFSLGKTHSGPGHTALVLAALLIPLNYVALTFMRERGLTGLTGADGAKVFSAAAGLSFSALPSFARLSFAAFPAGVCDYTRPGVNQQPTVPWLTSQTAAIS